MDKLTITIERDGDGYIAKVQEFDCVAKGQTVRKVLENISSEIICSEIRQQLAIKGLTGQPHNPKMDNLIKFMEVSK